ncbi:hypothetical protein F4803DRAFT_94323 [Xylaria telfairii]|nr:hypothetical protein F4803DRAFT_94323 [Xylaria telfairii]
MAAFSVAYPCWCWPARVMALTGIAKEHNPFHYFSHDSGRFNWYFDSRISIIGASLARYHEAYRGRRYCSSVLTSFGVATIR